MARERRWLVTGFGPFPGVAVNPTAALAAEVARRLSGPGVEVEARVLPVTWAAAAALAREAAGYAGVVALGVAASRRRVEVERWAVNAARGADAAGRLAPDAELVPGAPARLEGVLHRPPLDALVARAADRGLPVGYSDDAGRYVCNALFFHLLHARVPGDPRPVGFVHVPHIAGLSAPPDAPDALAPDLALDALCHFVEALVSGFARPVSTTV